MNQIDIKKKELAKIESQLDKCRTSALVDGWQTHTHSKKSRKWDKLAEEKRKLRDEIDLLEREEYQQGIDNTYCVSCGAIDEFQCICDE